MDISFAEYLFLIIFCVLEILFILLVFFPQRFKRIQLNFYYRAIFFCGSQILCLTLILFGGHLEKEKGIYSLFLKPIDEYRKSFPESVHIEGDAGLVRWVEGQRPTLARPNFSNSREFLLWQSNARRKLQDLFEIKGGFSKGGVQCRKISMTNISHNIKRIFLTFSSFDGTTIPAYLFLPKTNEPRPAVIVLPGHVGEYQEGISQTAGLEDSYQHGSAMELAKAGFVTLTIEFRGFGYLGRPMNTEHELVARNALLGGSFYKAILRKDIEEALGFLQTLPEVDFNRLGITGVSFGGEMAVTYAALDERIKVIVFQGFGGSIGIQEGVSRKDKIQPHNCHIIPRINRFFFKEDIYFLLAPRPLLGINGTHDYSGNRKLFSDVVGKAYRALNELTLFRFIILPGGHEYFVQPAIEFFKKYL
jgi:dienelactone hydrolase